MKSIGYERITSFGWLKLWRIRQLMGDRPFFVHPAPGCEERGFDLYISRSNLDSIDRLFLHYGDQSAFCLQIDTPMG